jgi:photosystem II stability/assembly factor-like uncharacterized protein
LGWVAVDRCRRNEFCDYHHSSLMYTSDAGQSWQRQYEADDMLINSIHFFDRENGWFVGAQFNNPSPFGALVFQTASGGHEWIDVSEGARRSLREVKDQTRSPSHDNAFQLISGKGGSLVLATGRWRVLSTMDNGRLWNEIAYLGGEGSQTGLIYFGVLNGQYWIAGATQGEEGVWSVLARQQNENLWTRYKLSGLALRHIYFVDSNKILACGSIPKANRLRTAERATNGVILASLDGGKSWTVIHEDPSIEVFNFLSADRSGRVWVVGSNGSVLRLGLPSRIFPTLQRRS